MAGGARPACPERGRFMCSRAVGRSSAGSHCRGGTNRLFVPVIRSPEVFALATVRVSVGFTTSMLAADAGREVHASPACDT